MAPNVDASKLEWQSLLGPLSRLSVYPREFVCVFTVHLCSRLQSQPEIWKAYFSNPTERKKDDIDANKSNLRHTLGGLQVCRLDDSRCTAELRQRLSFSTSTTPSFGPHLMREKVF